MPNQTPSPPDPAPSTTVDLDGGEHYIYQAAFVGEARTYPYCRACNMSWPCMVVRLLAENQQLRAEIAEWARTYRDSSTGSNREEELRTEIMRRWQATSEAGTVCQFCAASVAHDERPELMPHDPDCIVRKILTDLVVRNVVRQIESDEESGALEGFRPLP